MSVSEDAGWLGEWQTTATLTMTPSGPKVTAQDAKTKNTVGGLGMAAIGALSGWLLLP